MQEKNKNYIWWNLFSAFLVMVFTATVVFGICSVVTNNLEQEYRELKIYGDFESDLYEEELDFYDYLNDKLEEENSELKDENSKLKAKLEELEEELENKRYEPQTEGLHESYLACLEEIDNDYYDYRSIEIEGINDGSLKFIAREISKAYNSDDVIYHFIIVVYDDVFSVLDTWNCYTVYDGDEFMYADCDLVRN